MTPSMEAWGAIIPKPLISPHRDSPRVPYYTWMDNFHGRGHVMLKLLFFVKFDEVGFLLLIIVTSLEDFPHRACPGKIHHLNGIK